MAELLLCALLPLLAWAAVQFLLRYARWRHALIDRALPAAGPADAADAAGRPGPPPVPAGHAPGRCCWRCKCWPPPAFYLHRQWRDRSVSFWLMGALLARGGGGRRGRGCWPSNTGHAAAGGPAGAAGGAADAGADGPAPGAAARPRAAAGRSRQGAAGAARARGHGRDRAQLPPAVGAEDRAGHRARAQAHRRRPARRPGRQAADHRAHQRERPHLDAGARGAGGDAAVGARPDRPPVRLADALGDWRAEVVSRLAQAGIEAEWSAPDDLPQTLSARAYVQTTRILREATSNIIKHSGARSAACAARWPTATSSWWCRTTATASAAKPTADSTAATAWPR
jgi:two-component system sensor histidine kinase UhpB